MIITAKEAGTESYLARLRALLSDAPHRYRIYTFGCQQNEADSERLSALLEGAGFLPSVKEGDEDLILLNTCAIRKHAEEKALSLLGRFKAQKKQNPQLMIGVAGCMGAEQGIIDLLKKDFHYVSFTLDPSSLHKLPERLYALLTEGKRLFPPPAEEYPVVEGIDPCRSHSHRAWVSVMYGCNNFCSYCIVPYVRGRERSRPSDAVISECRRLAEQGVREITLLGQNVNSYRSDLTFPQLLSRIASIEGDFILRFMTSHPKDTSDELIEVLASNPKIAPFFHLPLQSGSDSILAAMNRTYSAEKYLSIVDKLRSAIPNIALSTDIIIGFPGETDGDFEQTLSILRRVEYDNVYAFLYSPREGTRAAKMTNTVPREVMDLRMERLLRLQDGIATAKNAPYQGRICRVLTDSVRRTESGCTCSGRTDTAKLVHFTASTATVGEFAQVRITEARPFDLIGERVQ